MSSPAKTRAPRMDPEDRRAQLIAVAEELFIDHGYAGVSMEDIARAAGVTRPVVYDHFGTREGAYLACVRQARAGFEATLLGGADPGVPIVERIRTGGEAFFTMLEEDPGRWRLVFASNAVLPGDANEELAALRFATIDRIRQLISGGVDPSVPAARIDACAHVISGAGERLGHWWLANPQLTRDEMVEHFVAVTWSGVAQIEATP